MQFTKYGTSFALDLNNYPVKIQSSSIENCASICVNATRLVNDNFKCYSFDFCKNSDGRGGVCAFYNASHLTDQSLIIDGPEVCDHYTSKEAAYFSIKYCQFISYYRKYGYIRFATKGFCH